MVGKIYIVRHGHGYHNAINNPVPNDPRLRDANLTIKGELQSVKMGQQFPDMDTVGVVLTSPLRRSVHTALLAFSTIIHERFYLPGEGGITGGIDLILQPKLQEIGDEIFNTGSPTAKLREEWPNLDLSLLISPWPRKTGLFDPMAADERATSVRQDLWQTINELATQPTKKNIVVVTHDGFLRELAEMPQLGIENGKYREFSISNSSGRPKLSMLT